MSNGYIRAIGDSDYNFGYNDFTVEFFVETTNINYLQTLFEITNNESAAADFYKKTRFTTLIENGNLNVYVIQTSWPQMVNTTTFSIPETSSNNIKIFFDGVLLYPWQYTFNNGIISLTGNIDILGPTYVEPGEILCSIKGNQLSQNTLHFVSVERKDNKLYLFLDGVLQGNVAISFNSIPDQVITNTQSPYQVLSRAGYPALLTIGANKDGNNPLMGKFGDFRVTNGIARHVVTLHDQNSIYSVATDANLGIRAQDIIIDGGNFVDSIVSHAPEEHIPTQLFDTLEIDVYQNANSSYLSSNISNVTSPISNISNPHFNANSLLLGYRLLKDSISIGPFSSYQFNTKSSTMFRVPWGTLNTDAATIQINGNSISSDSWIMVNNNLQITAPYSANSNVIITSTGVASYYSLGANASSSLASNLYSTDSTITLTDSTNFITPILSSNIRGKVFINGECITYLYIDRIHNVLSGLMRGVSGTGIPNVHLTNSRIISASYPQQISEKVGQTSWYNLANVPLANTNSNISSFLVSQGTLPPV